SAGPSLMLSVTTHRDAATAVARYFQRHATVPQQIVLFDLEIPLLDLLYLQTNESIRQDAVVPWLSLRDNPGSPRFRDHLSKMIAGTHRGHTVYYPNDRELESFVPMKIDRGEIRSWSILPEAESDYSFGFVKGPAPR